MPSKQLDLFGNVARGQSSRSPMKKREEEMEKGRDLSSSPEVSFLPLQTSSATKTRKLLDSIAIAVKTPSKSSSKSSRLVHKTPPKPPASMALVLKAGFTPKPAKGKSIVRKRKRTPTPSPSASPTESEESVVEVKSVKARRKAKTIVRSSPESIREVSPPAPKRKRKLRPIQNSDVSDAASHNSEDVDDLEMDFDTLQDTKLRSPQKAENKSLKALKAARAAKAAKLKKAEALKHGIVLGSDEEEPTLISSDEDSEGSSSGASSSSEAVKSDEFIAPDDENGPEMEDIRSMIPIELTVTASQKPIWHFRNFISRLVYMTLLPEEKTFSPELDEGQRKISTLLSNTISSLVRSQAWRQRVMANMELPEMAEQELEEAYDGCQACHLSGRRSKVMVTFSGAPYDRKTYRALNRQKRPKDSDEDTSDSSSSSDSYAGSGYRKIDLYIGRECLKRARIHHNLRHFEWTVMQQIKNSVRHLRATNPKEGQPEGDKAARKWSKKRKVDADRIIDALAHQKFQSIEYNNLTALIDSAKAMYAGR